MLSRISRSLIKLKIKAMPWKQISSFSIGKNYSFVSPQCISLGDKFSAEDNLRLQAWMKYKDQSFTPEINIGNHVSMMENCQVSCCSKVSIGDGVLFGANVFVTDNFHGNNSFEQMGIPPIDRPLDVRGEVIIGNNVWVGRNVCIMPGVHIGDGSVIGANSVVTRDIPAYCVAVGAPARAVTSIKEN